METPPPGWYPDPQREGMLRWWDGARWTENVQPASTAGRPVLGQEVTGGIGPVTFHGPGEQITHAYAPITDDRYAGIELAGLLAAQARAASGGGDVRVPAEHQAAVEAVYQLRQRGGMLGALAGIGEQLLVDTITDALPEKPRPAAATPDRDGIVAYGSASPSAWLPTADGGPLSSPPAHGAEPIVPRPPTPPTAASYPAAGGAARLDPRPAAEGVWTQPVAASDYRGTRAALRAGAAIMSLWGLVAGLGASVVVMLVGAVMAHALPSGDGPTWLVWFFPAVGAVGVVLSTRELVGGVRALRRQPDGSGS